MHSKIFVEKFEEIMCRSELKCLTNHTELGNILMSIGRFSCLITLERIPYNVEIYFNKDSFLL